MTAWSSATARSSAKRTLALIAIAVTAPVALSYAAYYLVPRTSFANYGELLPTRPIAPLSGTRMDGGGFRLDDLKGRWSIVIPIGGACEAGCVQQRLYATRQARTMQGREMERVERVLVVADDSDPGPAKVMLADHPGLIVVRAKRADMASLPKGVDALYLVDPLGNQVLAWPHDPDIKALSRDLDRVLKASRIG